MFGTSKSVTGLSAGTTYYYRVRAVNESGPSANSEEKEVVTTLDAPTANEASDIKGTSFTANWQILPGAESYRLDLSVSSSFASYVAGYNDLSVTATAQIVTDLSPGTTYYYRVRGVNESGASPSSNTMDVTTISQNYIRTIEVLVEGMTSMTQVEDALPGDKITNYTYFDDLGRPMQNVYKQGSPLGNDIVQPIVYDEFGREHRKYLPFVTNEGTGWFKENAINTSTGEYQNAALDFYNNQSDAIADDTKPWAETAFEPSPLNRVLKQGAPGAAWQPNSTPYATATDNSIKYAYQPNLEDEVLLWTYTLPTQAFPLGLVNAGTAAAPDYYSANELQKTLSKDEHQHEIIEYTDKQGRKILKKVQGPDNTWALTYSIYDDSGQLVCVIPPEAVSRLASAYYHVGSNNALKEGFLERWAFRYRYDGRRRTVIKQVPGADSVVMVYDKRDRVVFTQDGNQRNANEWLFTKYDGLNRPVMTGVYTHGSAIDSKTMAGLLSTTTLSEVYNGSTSNYGYSNVVFPIENCQVLSVTYYDNYDFKSLMSDPGGNFNYTSSEIAAIPASQGQDELPGQDEFAFDKVRGQVTGSQIRILNSGTFLSTANYYDDHYRLIQTTASNHKGGFDRLTNVYDFVGKVLRTKTRFVIPQSPDREIYQRFSYDHAGRLTNSWHRIEGAPEVLISSNEYNEIGQLMTKKLHYNNSAAEYRQMIDYRYNIRGWLENINNPTDATAEDLFNMELKYNLPTSKGGAAQFNGNISEAIWKSAGLDKQSYGYEYDPMNRITKALYYNIANPADDGFYNERIGERNESHPEQSLPAYDLNGNILNLLRNGKRAVGDYGLMDKLHYDYSGSGGNQLMFVSDNQPTSPLEGGFKEIVEETIDYAYDDNGNLTKDENKGILDIEYNHLNLPWKVSKSATEYLVYTYDATGKKLAQQVFGVVPKTTDYVGELVLEGNTLQFILHAEGRIVEDTQPGAPDPWEYQYFLKDHLGNTRVVFSEKTTSEEYTATMEDAEVIDEMADFSHYPTARSGLNEFDHTDEGSVYTRSMVLHGGENSQIGLAKSFEVNPGDVFDLEVYAKYQAPTENPSDLDGLFSQVVSAFSLGSNTTPLDGAAAYSAFEDLFQGGAPWINSSMWDPAPPKAYLNYLLFDENFILVDFGFDQVSADCEQEGLDPIVPHDHLSLHVKVEQKGFLYVYLSNEQPEVVTDVYFDDMKIVYYSAVEQVDDYYPFGLTFNSYSRQNTTPNRIKFQGQEHIDDLSLGWDSFKWRNHQPDIGRFFNVDPLAEDYLYNSPYAFSENKVTSHVEIEGLESQSIHPNLKKEVDKVERVVMHEIYLIKKLFEMPEQKGKTEIEKKNEEPIPVPEDQKGPRGEPDNNTNPQFNPGAKAEGEKGGDKVIMHDKGQKSGEKTDTTPPDIVTDTIGTTGNIGPTGEIFNKKYIIQNNVKVDSFGYFPDRLLPKNTVPANNNNQ